MHSLSESGLDGRKNVDVGDTMRLAPKNIGENKAAKAAKATGINILHGTQEIVSGLFFMAFSSPSRQKSDERNLHLPGIPRLYPF